MKPLFLLLLLFFTSCTFANENKEIIVASESWKGATNRDGSGLYWDVIKAVYEPLGYTIIKKHLRFNESAEMVRSDNADIFLGAYKNMKSYIVTPKYYFDQKVIVAVFRNEAIEQWEGQESFEGLKMGWVRGYDYDQYLKANVRVEELSNRNNGLKQLKNERLDAFIDDREYLRPYLLKAKLDSDEFTKKIIMQLKLYPGFSKNSKGKRLMAQWDKQMKKLIKTDVFKKLYFESEYTLFPY